MSGIVLEHDGYLAEITYAEGDRDMHGLVINASATLHFAGQSIDDLKKAFADTVDEYVAWCRERGKEPEKPYSGQLPLRLSPKLHRALAVKATHAGQSMNTYVARLIEHDLCTAEP
jgi:predicted HicB family RNase H-like nuclease